MARDGKKKGGRQKIGRNLDKCKQYRAEGRREKNKARRAARRERVLARNEAKRQEV